MRKHNLNSLLPFIPSLSVMFHLSSFFVVFNVRRMPPNLLGFQCDQMVLHFVLRLSLGCCVPFLCHFDFILGCIYTLTWFKQKTKIWLTFCDMLKDFATDIIEM